MHIHYICADTSPNSECGQMSTHPIHHSSSLCNRCGGVVSEYENLKFIPMVTWIGIIIFDIRVFVSPSAAIKIASHHQ